MQLLSISSLGHCFFFIFALLVKIIRLINHLCQSVGKVQGLIGVDVDDTYSRSNRCTKLDIRKVFAPISYNYFFHFSTDNKSKVYTTHNHQGSLMDLATSLAGLVFVLSHNVCCLLVVDFV